MAGELKHLGPPPWNPLACSDTPLAPNALLMAKLAVLLLFVKGFVLHLGVPFAPLVSGLDKLRHFPSFGIALQSVFVAASACLLVNRFVRTSALLLGVLVLFEQVQSEPALNGYALLCGCVLLLVGLHRGGEQPTLVQWQLVLLYLVAAANKFANPDWTGGSIVETWLSDASAHPAAAWFAALMPAGFVPAVLPWAIIACEVLLAIGLAVPRTRKWTVFGGIVFQLAVHVTFSSAAMGSFSIAMGIAYLSFLRWPRGQVVVLWPRACGWPLWLRIALDRFDWDRRLSWPQPPDPDADLEVSYDGGVFFHWRGLCKLLLAFPAFYFAGFAFLLGTQLLLRPGLAAIVHAVVIAPLCVFFAVPTLRRAQHRLRRRVATALT